MGLFLASGAAAATARSTTGLYDWLTRSKLKEKARQPRRSVIELPYAAKAPRPGTPALGPLRKVAGPLDNAAGSGASGMGYRPARKALPSPEENMRRLNAKPMLPAAQRTQNINTMAQQQRSILQNLPPGDPNKYNSYGQNPTPQSAYSPQPQAAPKPTYSPPMQKQLGQLDQMMANRPAQNSARDMMAQGGMNPGPRAMGPINVNRPQAQPPLAQPGPQQQAIDQVLMRIMNMAATAPNAPPKVAASCCAAPMAKKKKKVKKAEEALPDPSPLAQAITKITGLSRTGKPGTGWGATIRDHMNPPDATSLWEMPWAYGAVLPAALSGVYAGWKPTDAVFSGLRKSDEEAELDESKSLYEEELKRQALAKAAEDAPTLDDCYDNFEKAALVEPYEGLLNFLFSTSALGSGLWAYNTTAKGNSKKVLEEALKRRQREMFTRNPKPFVVKPVPVYPGDVPPEPQDDSAEEIDALGVPRESGL